MPHLLTAPLLKWASRLRYPTLAKLVAALFVVNLFVPDPVPFVDELALGLATLLLGNWRRKDSLPPPLPGA
ncbi:MAG TPA: DUF6116 family protein [Stenotrophomonas sp.]|jgi:hypothetical protein